MRLSNDTWQQIKAGYAAGIGLREIARNMNVPEGTVLARANREGWTQQIAAAKQAVALTQSNAITPTPMQSIAALMQERGERYRDRIAGGSERVVGHIEAMCPDEILTRSSQFEKIDTNCAPNIRIERCPSWSGVLEPQHPDTSLSRAGEGVTSNHSVACRIAQFWAWGGVLLADAESEIQRESCWSFGIAGRRRNSFAERTSRKDRPCGASYFRPGQAPPRGQRRG